MIAQVNVRKYEMEVLKPIQYYLKQTRQMSLNNTQLSFLSPADREFYLEELQVSYDILYDRVMHSNVSVGFKRELEEWYSFYTSFFGFMEPKEINRELEKLFRRFDLS